LHVSSIQPPLFQNIRRIVPCGISYCPLFAAKKAAPGFLKRGQLGMEACSKSVVADALRTFRRNFYEVSGQISTLALENLSFGGDIVFPADRTHF